jgi:hypothetical protein
VLEPLPPIARSERFVDTPLNSILASLVEILERKEILTHKSVYVAGIEVKVKSATPPLPAVLEAISSNVLGIMPTFQVRSVLGFL